MLYIIFQYNYIWKHKNMFRTFPDIALAFARAAMLVLDKSKSSFHIGYRYVGATDRRSSIFSPLRRLPPPPSRLLPPSSDHHRGTVQPSPHGADSLATPTPSTYRLVAPLAAQSWLRLRWPCMPALHTRGLAFCLGRLQIFYSLRPIFILR
jgi:hypothetical protein